MQIFNFRLEHHVGNRALTKQIIITEINNEIKRLESTFFGENQKKIMALKELTSRIINANPSLTLIGTIEAWLTATPNSSRETYESSIKSQRIFGSGKTTSSSFIDKLITNYEINEHCMAAFQTAILIHIFSIVSVIKQMNPDYSSLLFQEVNDACMQNNINTQSLIKILKQRCTANPAVLFAENTTGEDKKILQLYKLIRGINLDDSYSLNQTSLSLKNLYGEIKKDFDMKVAVQKKSIPPH